MYFVKLEKEFREIIHYWENNEITCLNERTFFSYTLSKGYFFSFQHKLHQSTNMYNFHGSGSTVDCSGCSNPDELFDELFGYYKINNVVVVIYRRKCFFK